MESNVIDLATCKRSEFIEAYQEVEKERDYWRELAHDLEIRLQEHEGVQPTDEEKEADFQQFWAAFGRVGNVKTARKRYFKLNKKNKAQANKAVKYYVKSTVKPGQSQNPNDWKPTRKAADSWILNEHYNDIIHSKEPDKLSKRAHPSFADYKAPDTQELRQANRAKKIDVKSLLKDK